MLESIPGPRISGENKKCLLSQRSHRYISIIKHFFSSSPNRNKFNDLIMSYSSQSKLKKSASRGACQGFMSASPSGPWIHPHYSDSTGKKDELGMHFDELLLQANALAMKYGNQFEQDSDKYHKVESVGNPFIRIEQSDSAAELTTNMMSGAGPSGPLTYSERPNLMDRCQSQILSIQNRGLREYGSNHHCKAVSINVQPTNLLRVTSQSQIQSSAKQVRPQTPLSHESNTSRNRHQFQSLKSDKIKYGSQQRHNSERIQGLMKRLFTSQMLKQQKLEDLQTQNLIREKAEMRSAPQVNQRSIEIAEHNKFLMIPLHIRYKEILNEKERRHQDLEHQVRQEQANKDPENYHPLFKPDLSQSQDVVTGRRSQERDHFNTFLRDMNMWKLKKEKKIRDLQNQEIQKEIEQGLFQPRISQKSVKLLEQVKRKGHNERENFQIEGNRGSGSRVKSRKLTAQKSCIGFTQMLDPLEQLKANSNKKGKRERERE